MSKKLTPHGDGYALIIDKPLLQVLNISENTTFTISVQDGALIVRPIHIKISNKQSSMKKAAQEIMEEYSDVFEKLAK